MVPNKFTANFHRVAPRPLPRCLVTERLQSNERRCPFPSRPVPKWLVTEQVYHKKTSAFHYRPDHDDCRRISWFIVMVLSYYRGTVALPRLPSFYHDNRQITAFTVDSRHYRRFSISLPTVIQVSRHRPSLPQNCRRFPLPSGPLPRCIVTKQV